MGGFDPTSLLNFLNGAQGNSSGLQQTAPTSTPAPQAPAPSPAPPPAAPQQPQASPQQSGIRGYLSNIFYNMGEAAKAHLGMPTDVQVQQAQQRIDLQKQQIDAETALKRQQLAQMGQMVTLPNGMQVPFALAKPYLDYQGKQYAADAAAKSKVIAETIGKRFVPIAGVGMFDTQAPGGPTLVPGSNPMGVQVTDDIAKEYNIPDQLKGKTIPLTQFSQFIRGASQQFTIAQGANGPAIVNKPAAAAGQPGAVTSLGIGSPSLGGATNTLGPDGQIVPTTKGAAIASGSPMVATPNATQVMGKQALIDDIHGGINQLKDASAVLDNPSSRLKIAAAMAEPGLTVQTAIQSPILGSMSPQEQDYVIKLLSLREQAMAMRSVLGAGQGSEDLRKAILATVPNAATPNSAYAQRQLDQFATTLDRVSKGVPKISKPAPATAKPTARYNPVTKKIEPI